VRKSWAYKSRIYEHDDAGRESATEWATTREERPTWGVRLLVHVINVGMIQSPGWKTEHCTLLC